MSHVVRVEGLTKRYGQVTALDDVSFTIARDSIVGLLGRNGAGKTTLLQILSAQGSRPPAGSRSSAGTRTRTTACCRRSASSRRARSTPTASPSGTCWTRPGLCTADGTT
ncbi:MAG: ATP-binding cassette domain-containing protein, partial [Nocardioidaceae bacterium]